MRRSDLRRLLGGYRRGWHSDQWFRSAVEEEVGRLLEARAEMESAYSEIREYGRPLLRELERGIYAAIRHMGLQEYERCLDGLWGAHLAWWDLEEVAKTLDYLGEVEHSRRELMLQLDLGALEDLPTLSALSKLSARARELLAEGEPRKAAVVGWFCEEETRVLGQPGALSRLSEPVENGVDSTSVAVDLRQRQTGAGGRHFAAAGPKLEELADAGYSTLFQRLHADLLALGELRAMSAGEERATTLARQAAVRSLADTEEEAARLGRRVEETVKEVMTMTKES